MFNSWRRSDKLAFPFKVTGPPVPIVGIGAIATEAIGDGRFVPVCVLDANLRPDIVKLIEVHGEVPPGDVISAWGSVNRSENHIALFLHFQRPIELAFVLNFDIAGQGAVVDLALKSRVLALQAGNRGDSLLDKPGKPIMWIELGGYMPPNKWDDLWFEATRRKLRANGHARYDAKKVAAKLIAQMRANLSGTVESFVPSDPS